MKNSKNCRHAELDSASRCSIKGFTLIELLVVVLIIGILAGVAVPQYQKAVDKARAIEGVTGLKTLTDGINLLFLEQGQYPTTFNVGYSWNNELENLGLTVDVPIPKDGYYIYDGDSKLVYVEMYNLKKSFTLYNYLSGGKVSRSCCSGTGCIYFPDVSAC